MAVTRNVVTIALLIGTVALPGRASAQVVPALAAPTSEECRAAASSLASGSRNTLEWHLLPECGTMGARALATALAGAGSETGDSYLQMLTSSTSSVRAEPILDAAETLARDAGATRAARVAGLLVLLHQYDVALYPPINIPWEELTSVPLPRCSLLAVTDVGYSATYPMPDGWVERIRGVAQDLSHASDPAVQALARCMARRIRARTAPDQSG